MGLSSNSIIHFTDEKDYLKGILTNNFKIKYCAETLIFDKENISQLMGYADIKTTQRYSNTKEQMGKDALDVFLEIFKK